mmetsp:Transcript_82954/g.253524  ORF Transcript_82954/g.253524 Transcript_82954/m.253524 type:complete len:260 (+) Transcript_82954:371-1150(+)
MVHLLAYLLGVGHVLQALLEFLHACNQVKYLLLQRTGPRGHMLLQELNLFACVADPVPELLDLGARHVAHVLLLCLHVLVLAPRRRCPAAAGDSAAIAYDEDVQTVQDRVLGCFQICGDSIFSVGETRGSQVVCQGVNHSLGRLRRSLGFRGVRAALQHAQPVGEIGEPVCHVVRTGPVREAHLEFREGVRKSRLLPLDLRNTAPKRLDGAGARRQGFWGRNSCADGPARTAAGIPNQALHGVREAVHMALQLGPPRAR